MRAVSFGRLNVQNHGVPVKMGQSTLSANIAAADESLSLTSATPFCQDMIPFKMMIDPSTASSETVIVRALNGSTMTIQRGVDGTIPSAHGSAAVLMAVFPFAGWEMSVVAGLTGKMYWGRNLLTAGGAGTIYEFWPNAAGGVDDHRSFMASAEDGNPLCLTDYALDSAVDAEGLYLTVWVR